MASRVIHFEIGCDDPKRAAKFYGDVFGWDVKKWEGPVDYWLAGTGDKSEMGIDGALLARPKPDFRCVNTISVDDIDEAEKKIVAAGGKTMTKKDEIPGVGMFMYCVDTEGNQFGVLQPKM